MTIDEYFENNKKWSLHSGDINEHLDTLRHYASQCDHVTEMGFWHGCSFSAFLAGRPKKLVTYDTKIDSKLVETIAELQDRTTDLHFIPGNTLEIEIEETDLLFIDTLHTYDQLRQELNLHADKAHKYIILHDTETFGKESEDGTTPGLLDAIYIFLMNNPEWSIHEFFRHNNGLVVLKRGLTHSQK